MSCLLCSHNLGQAIIESAAERDHRHWSLATSLQRVLNLSAKGELPGFSTSRQRENGVTFRDAASFQKGRMETLVEDQHFAIFPLRRQHCHLLARAEERELWSVVREAHNLVASCACG